MQNYSRSIELDPKYSAAYYDRGIANFRQGKYEDAVTDNTIVIEMNPDYTNAFINRGLSYDKLTKYQLALNDYVSAIKISPDYELAYNNLTILLNDCIRLKNENALELEVESSIDKINNSELEKSKKDTLTELLNNFK